MDYRYDVFLSYRRSDGARFARALKRKLEKAHKGLPEDRPPLRVYLDEIYARATEDFFREEVRPALLSSRWVLLIATPDAARRPDGAEDWIEREIQEFEAARGLSQIRVIHAGGAALPALPCDILARMPNAQENDLRGFDRWFPPARARDDWLGLLSTVFELPAEAMPKLRQWEERARARRNGFAAGAVAGLAAFAIGLSGFALYRTAEAARLVDLSAAAMEQAIAATPKGDEGVLSSCAILDQLIAGGARARLGPLVTCHAARALDLAAREGAEAALAAMGSWAAFLADAPSHALPKYGAADGFDYERAAAKLAFEEVRLDLENRVAEGVPLLEDDPGESGVARHRALLDLNLDLFRHEATAGFGAFESLVWRTVILTEAHEGREASVPLMRKVAAVLDDWRRGARQAAGADFAAFDQDDDRLILMSRLLTFAAIEGYQDLGDTEAALADAGLAARVFKDFEAASPWARYHRYRARAFHALIAEQVAPQDAEARESARAALTTATLLMEDPGLTDEQRADVRNLAEALPGLEGFGQ